MKSIYKYPFEINDEFVIKMPAMAAVLSVQVQHGTPCVWALVNTENSLVERKFSLRGTGHSAEDLISSYFVGTFQMKGGDLVGTLVFHLFERS